MSLRMLPRCPAPAWPGPKGSDRLGARLDARAHSMSFAVKVGFNRPRVSASQGLGVHRSGRIDDAAGWRPPGRAGQCADGSSEPGRPVVSATNWVPDSWRESAGIERSRSRPAQACGGRCPRSSSESVTSTRRSRQVGPIMGQCTYTCQPVAGGRLDIVAGGGKRSPRLTEPPVSAIIRASNRTSFL